MDKWIEKIGVISAIILPFFNIPLILHLVRRKSSGDFSMSWALGVWACIALMTPQSLRSTDPAFRSYGVLNLVFFSAVALLIIKYRRR